MLGYALLSGELCVLVRLEHVITVPGDTVVVWMSSLLEGIVQLE